MVKSIFNLPAECPDEDGIEMKREIFANNLSDIVPQRIAATTKKTPKASKKSTKSSNK